MGSRQYPAKRKHLKPWERADHQKRHRTKKLPKYQVQQVHDEVVVMVDTKAVEEAVHDWVKLPCQEMFPKTIESHLTKAMLEEACKQLAMSAAKSINEIVMVVPQQTMQAHISEYADYASFSEIFSDPTDRKVEGEEVFQCTMGWEHSWNQVRESSVKSVVGEKMTYYDKEFLETLKKNMTFGGFGGL